MPDNLLVAATMESSCTNASGDSRFPLVDKQAGTSSMADDDSLIDFDESPLFVSSSMSTTDGIDHKLKTTKKMMKSEADGGESCSLSSSFEDLGDDFNTSSGIGASFDVTNQTTDTSADDETAQKRLNISHMLQVMKERLNVSTEDNQHQHRDNETGLHSYLLNASLRSYSEDSELSDLSVSTGDGFEEFYKRYRCSEIQKELKLMTSHHQDGVYVAPSSKSIEMWFGVMFIRDGPYKDGIFHFTVYFSDDFPEARPALKFKSPIFHPQIKAKTGTLNLKPVYDKSGDARVWVWEVIKYARSCFYHLNVTNAYNAEAAHVFQSDLNMFKARCRNSVLDSLLEFEEQKHQKDHQSENPFRGTILENGLCGAVRKAIVNADRGDVAKHGIFGWAKSQLGRVLNNINASYEDREEII